MLAKPLRLALLSLVASALTLAPVASVLATPPHPTVNIQILNVSDWHAQLDPVNGIGGAAVLSSYFKADRLANPNTLTVTAGDAYGASPPLSSFFAEEPAILAMRLMGFNIDALGNHNFDRGIVRLQPLIDLAGDTSGTVPGQPFSYVSANLEELDDNLTGVAPYQIFEVGGIKIGVIGITNPEAPTLTFPGSFGTLTPTDPVPAALEAREEAREAGAKIIVAITHLGVTGFDSTGAATGPLIDFAKAVNNKKNPRFNVIIGDHTDIQYSGIINGALVIENKSKGATYAKINLTVDAKNKKILSQSATFVVPFANAVVPDQAIVDLLAPYRAQLTPILSTVVGSATRVIPRTDACGNTAGRICESLVGNATTDALRSTYATDFAITNSGGLRANLTCPTTDNLTDFCPAFVPPPFLITNGQVLTVLPFGNVVVTLMVSGAELKTMLENGVSSMPAVNGRFPQVSGLCFTYDISALAGSRVTGAVRQAADGSCTGTAIDLTAASSYTLAENDFMASGGDGYPNFLSRIVTRDVMANVLNAYVSANSPISPAIQGRIVCTTSGTPACPVVTP